MPRRSRTGSGSCWLPGVSNPNPELRGRRVGNRTIPNPEANPKGEEACCDRGRGVRRRAVIGVEG